MYANVTRIVERPKLQIDKESKTKFNIHNFQPFFFTNKNLNFLFLQYFSFNKTFNILFFIPSIFN